MGGLSGPTQGRSPAEAVSGTTNSPGSMLESNSIGRPTTLIGASSVGPRVLVVSSIQLDPPTHGNRARNRALVGALRRAGCDVHYLFWSTSSDEMYPADAMRGLVDSGELVRARAPRTLRNLQRFARNTAHVLGRARVLPANLWWALSGDRFSSTLCPTPLLVRVRELLATQSFDAVIASYANLGPVAALAREHGALAIIDTHDLLHERAEAVRRNRIFPSGTIIDRTQEARLLSQADLVLAIQSRESRELAPLVGASRVMIYPRGGTAKGPHDQSLVAAVPTGADETDGLDVTSAPLPGFPGGLLAMMNSRPKNFLLFSWSTVATRLRGATSAPGGPR